MLENNKKLIWIVISFVMGTFVIFSLGTLQLYFVYYHDWLLAFTNGFLIFSWWDMVKIAAAAGIYGQLVSKARES